MERFTEKLAHALKVVGDIEGNSLGPTVQLQRVNTQNVNVKRLNEGAVIPSYAREGDAGFDLVATEDVIVEPGETKLVPTGLSFEIPPGYELQIRPRSGVTLKTKLRVQLGTVDSGYRGEVGVIVDNTESEGYSEGEWVLDVSGNMVGWSYVNEFVDGTYVIQKGDRIAQGVVTPVATIQFEEVTELGESSRGDGGFGSSGVTS
jgi:dUTP pyrophosphatase